MKELEHYKSFPLAGFTFYEGALVFGKLKVGKKLRLVLEPENKYDPQAVAVYFKGYKLGFVPKNSNYSISKFLSCGFNVFEARIQRIDPTASPEHQVGVVVYLKKVVEEKLFELAGDGGVVNEN
ncbi:MAG: HIRAN domain-containing protein [Mangrovibacterium sp.]